MAGKKKGGIWFVVLPILCVFVLAYTKLLSSNKDNQNKGATRSISSSVNDGSASNPVADGQKPSIDSEMKRISYPPKRALIATQSAHLYDNFTTGSQRCYSIPMKHVVFHIANRGGFLFCRFINNLNEQDSAWILQGDLVATEEDLEEMYQHNISVSKESNRFEGTHINSDKIGNASQTPKNEASDNRDRVVIDVSKEIENGKRLQAEQKRYDSMARGLIQR